MTDKDDHDTEEYLTIGDYCMEFIQAMLSALPEESQITIIVDTPEGGSVITSSKDLARAMEVMKTHAEHMLSSANLTVH